MPRERTRPLPYTPDELMAVLGVTAEGRVEVQEDGTPINWGAIEPARMWETHMVLVAQLSTLAVAGAAHIQSCPCRECSNFRPWFNFSMQTLGDAVSKAKLNMRLHSRRN